MQIDNFATLTIIIIMKGACDDVIMMHFEYEWSEYDNFTGVSCVERVVGAY